MFDVYYTVFLTETCEYSGLGPNNINHDTISPLSLCQIFVFHLKNYFVAVIIKLKQMRWLANICFPVICEVLMFWVLRLLCETLFLIRRVFLD